MDCHVPMGKLAVSVVRGIIDAARNRYIESERIQREMFGDRIGRSFADIEAEERVPHPAEDALMAKLQTLSDDELFTLERLMYLGRDGDAGCPGHDRDAALDQVLGKMPLMDYLESGLRRIASRKR